MDPADDPGFLRCEPWGFARQIFAPHQMEIRQAADRIEMRYGEWDGRRTVYLDEGSRPASQPASPMGFSVGRYEGDALVVETSAVTANLMGIFPLWFKHGDQLRAVERYTRTADGSRLELIVTIEDPLSLRQPLRFRKAWAWAPDEQILPYTLHHTQGGKTLVARDRPDDTLQCLPWHASEPSRPLPRARLSRVP